MKLIIYLSYQLLLLFLTTFEFYSYICVPIVNNNYICKNNYMDNKDTIHNNNEQEKIEPLIISEMKDEESKVIFTLFKILVESHPNDADLGKEFRILFNNIKFD